MQSTLFEELVAERVAEAREQVWAEGRAEMLAGERDLCLDMLRELHPALVKSATPVVKACPDPELLRKWILLAPKTQDDTELARLMGLRRARKPRTPRRRG